MIVAAFALAGCLAINAPNPTAASIRERMSSAGATATLSELYRNQKGWRRFLRGIASGDREMVPIGAALYKVADGGVAEDLVHAFGEALKVNPEMVLSIAGKDVGVKLVCSPPDVDDVRFDSFAAASRELDRRERAVRVSVGDARRVQCLRSLVEARTALGHFFSK